MPGNQAVGQVRTLAPGWSRWGICALLFPAIIHALNPRLEPMQFDAPHAPGR